MDSAVGKILENRENGLLSFVSTKYFSGNYVKVSLIQEEKNALFIIGNVISVEAKNPFFDKAIMIKYTDEEDLIKSKSIFIYHFKTVSYIQNGNKVDTKYPPSPGTNVYPAHQEEIFLALGIDANGIGIGTLKNEDNISVKISFNDLFRTHFAILGRTGQGKSYLLKNICKKIQNNIQILIFSPSEEYNALAKELGFRLYTLNELTLPLEIGYISMIYGFTTREQLFFDAFLKSSKSITEEGRILTSDIILKFKEWFATSSVSKQSQIQFPEEKRDMTKELPQYGETLLAKMRHKELVFSKSPMRPPFPNSCVIDMSELRQEGQEVVVAYILSSILTSYKKMLGKKLLIVYEEVHNFAPSVQTTQCKDKIIQISREGRKLGISTCMISQRPKFIDQTALSQCGSLFLFNIPHPDDVNHVFGVSPVYSVELPEIVRNLGVGEALIIGDTVKYPLICKIEKSN